MDAGLPIPDAGVDAGPAGPVVYPFAVRHSPVTASVVANLKRIAAIAPRLDGVFAKIGDSNTVNTNFLSGTTPGTCSPSSRSPGLESPSRLRPLRTPPRRSSRGWGPLQLRF